MKRYFQFISILFAGASLFIFSNCTVIGFTTGAIVDSSNPRIIEDPVEVLLDLPKNSHIQVFLKNGETRKGRFVGYVPDPVVMDKILYLSIAEKSVETTFPIEVIDHVANLKNPNRNKLIGLGVGGLIDVILLTLFVVIASAGD